MIYLYPADDSPLLLRYNQEIDFLVILGICEEG